MKSVLLDKSRHDRKRFDCGVKALNNYLQLMASQQLKKDNTRTFILEDEQHPQFIKGYYSLTMTTIDLNALPPRLRKKHQNANSAGLIARLAVDRRYSRKGFGEWLLVDALAKLLTASETVAFPFIIVDSKEGMAPFYEKFVFSSFLDTPDKLFITVADVRNIL